MSSEAPILSVSEVAKCYQIYDHPKLRLKQFLWRGRRHFYREFWALHPTSFNVAKGECIGFVGRNGSGKSTLLQMIAGTLTPTSGTLAVNGRVAALLELGAGFNPEFTGRENVHLNAAVLGLSRQEIRDAFADIAAFAEIGEFMEQPVKTYSSGMYVRLAFSVAIHVRPDVLVVDEALSVGDAAFQFKCMQKIEALRDSGMSIVFVTHDTGAVKKFCDRAGWLHDGRLVSLGPALEVANQYEDFMREKMKVRESLRPAADSAASPAGAVIAEGAVAVHARILETELRDPHGAPASVFVIGGDLRLRIRYQVLHAPPRGLIAGAAIFRNDNLYVCGLNTGLDRQEPPATPGIHEITITYPALPLLAGSYYFKVGIFDHTGLIAWDFHSATCPFTVSGPYMAEGVVLLNHNWEEPSDHR